MSDRITTKQLRIKIARLNETMGRPTEPVTANGNIARADRRPNALFLVDRGGNYPYRYSLGVRDDNVGCYSYYMGGTGRYFTAAGLMDYLNGIADGLHQEGTGREAHADLMQKADAELTTICKDAADAMYTARQDAALHEQRGAERIRRAIFGSGKIGSTTPTR